MIKLKSETIKWLARVYAVANTPSYLYRHFREEETIKNLAAVCSEKELVEYIIEVDSKDAPKLSEVVSAYACCIALTFHNLKSVIAVMKGVKLSRLEWVERILKIWEICYTSTLVVDTGYYHKPEIEAEEKTKSDVGTERINLRYQHEPKITEQDVFELDSSLTNIIHSEGKND